MITQYLQRENSFDEALEGLSAGHGSVRAVSRVEHALCVSAISLGQLSDCPVAFKGPAEASGRTFTCAHLASHRAT